MASASLEKAEAINTPPFLNQPSEDFAQLKDRGRSDVGLAGADGST